MTQNFLILQNFILCRSLISQKCQFWAKFSMQLIMSGFCQALSKISFLSQISNIAKAQLKISGFFQISSLVCPEWSKLSNLGLIFIAIENFWILPTFIFRMSWMVKNVSFELNFWQESKFHHWQVRGGQTLDFKLNLQRDWKYLDFAKFHPSQVWSGQKSWFWARFSMQLKISWFCQISTFACPEWLKLSTLGLIFIAIENFWILPNFILRMSWVVKNVCFKPNFQHDSKFLDFTKFHPLQVF